MRKNIITLSVAIVIFFIGAYVGANTNIFSNEELDFESALGILYPDQCIDENEGLNCTALFDGLTTTWETNNDTCVNSSVQFTFSSPQLIEFITIDEAPNMTSNNVKELQISGDFETRIVELTSEDAYHEWIDLYETVYILEITILSLYENPATSKDCGIEEITFYGRDA